MSPLSLFLVLVLPAYAAGVGTREIAHGIHVLYLRRTKGTPMLLTTRRRIDALIQKADSPRVVIPLLGFLAVVASLALIVALVSRGDAIERTEHLAKCSAQYNDYDSEARQVRTDASVDQSKALRDAIEKAGALLDPTVTPTADQIVDARVSLAEFVQKADGYDKAIAKYPYKSFNSFCGGGR